MKHILLELPGEPQPNEYPLIVEDITHQDEGGRTVRDRRGIEIGGAFEVELGAGRLPPADTKTTIHRGSRSRPAATTDLG